MEKLALAVDDLLRAIDYNSDARSRRCTANLTRFDSVRGVLDFVTRSSGSKTSWVQRVSIPDWELLDEETFLIKNWQQLVSAYPEVKEMDIKVACSCPSFAFNGPSYIVDELDAGDVTLPRYQNAPRPEGTPPNVRDKNLEHTLCKHLIAVLRRFW
jgi:hypothetical protein